MRIKTYQIYHIISYHIISYHISYQYIISYHIISYHIIYHINISYQYAVTMVPCEVIILQCAGYNIHKSTSYGDVSKFRDAQIPQKLLSLVGALILRPILVGKSRVHMGLGVPLFISSHAIPSRPVPVSTSPCACLRIAVPHTVDAAELASEHQLSLISSKYSGGQGDYTSQVVCCISMYFLPFQEFYQHFPKRRTVEHSLFHCPPPGTLSLRCVQPSKS